jgi:glucose dehydrogenase
LWRKNYPVAVPGGSAVTAGGLMFVGIGGTGRFQALDVKTGKVLWQHKFNQRIDDAASVYSVNGKEYVLIGLGGTSIVTSYGGYNVSPAKFVAFALR